MTRSPLWGEVRRLVDEQKYESAYEKLVALRESLAADPARETESTEALVQQVQLRIGLHGYASAVELLREQPPPRSFLTRTIIELTIACALRAYLQAYSWEIRQRPTVSSKERLPLEQMTAQQIVAEALQCFERLWRARSELDQAPASVMGEILDQGSYPPGIREGLRDLVSYLCVELLADTSHWRPEESSELYRLGIERLLGEQPAGASFELPDARLHPLLRLCGVLDDLERWHLSRGEREPALEARLERLRRLAAAFNGDDDARERASLEALARELVRRERDLGWSAWASVLLAGLLRRKGDLVGAHQVAGEAAFRFGGQLGGGECETIVRELEAPDYRLESMQVDGTKRRTCLVSHKNLGTLYFRAIPLDLEAHITSGRDYNLLPGHKEWRAALESTPAERCVSWKLELAATPDLRMHRTYLSPPLERPGLYAIFASAKPDFREGPGNRVVACDLLVSELVLLAQDTSDRSREVMVVSGKNGEPIAGATVELWETNWNRGHRCVKTATTDANGACTFRRLSEGRWYFLLGRHGGQLTIQPQGSGVYGTSWRPRDEDALVYTDRSIYRPEQKLHLKIVTFKRQPDRDRYGVLPRTKVEVELLDPNAQAVQKVTLKTSEHGTASTTFEIPAGRPLGLWRIRTSLGGEGQIRVEEYKRPTFEMRWLPSTKPSRLNEPVELVGEARYFFGMPVTEGRVGWRVERTPDPPPWFWFAPPAKPERVASGEALLGADGRFTVAFTAEVDPRLAGKPELAFRYTVRAELTDEGGETAKATQTLRLGFCDVEAAISQEGEFVLEQAPALVTVTRTDRNGAPRPGRASFTVVKVVQPDVAGGPADAPEPATDGQLPGWITLPGDRLQPRWANRYLPEREMASYPDGEVIATGELEHGADGRASIQLPSLAAGLVRIRYRTRDDGGHAFETAHEVLCVGASTPIGVPVMLAVQQTTLEVGGTARIFAASGTYDQVLILDVLRDGERLSRTLLRPGERELFELPIAHEHRGGLCIALSAVRDYQLVHLERRLVVPWTDKTLQIEWSTFRDRLQPGQHESWRLTLRSHDGKLLEGAVAEVLAYMYDRSLDSFVPHAPRAVLSVFPDRATGRQMVANLGGVTGYAFMGDQLFAPVAHVQLTGARLRRLESYGVGGLGARFGVPGGVARTCCGVPPPAPCAAPAPEGAAPMMAAKAMAAPGPQQLEAPCEEEAAPALSLEEGGGGSEEAVELRTSFAETAFFLPHVLNEADGSVTLSFDMPDSVTAWTVWVHAITRDLCSASVKREARTVKELMIRPYAPRFLREGDQAELRVLVQNAGEEQLEGRARIEILDGATEQSLLSRFGVVEASRPFQLAAGGSQVLTFSLKVPPGIGPIALRLEARAGNRSDGELRPLPVLPGRMHLAQSRFVTLRNAERRAMEFPDMVRGDDPSLEHEQLVVTLDAQLLYKVLEALPYLVEFPYECCEQLLNRFVSCSLLSSIYAESPLIAQAGKALAGRETPLERWDDEDPNRRMALEETPWLRQARGGESPFALVKLLDPEVASRHRQRSLRKLGKAQTSGGGFPWFPGGPPSPFITLYLLEGVARALELGVEVPGDLVRRAFSYLAGHFRSDILPRMRRNEISPEVITYLLHVLAGIRDDGLVSGSFSRAEREELMAYSFAHWKEQAPLLKSQLALALHRVDRREDARLVFGSVLDCARSAPDQGTFWAAEERSWLWYNDTIEGHAQALVTTQEIFPDHRLRDGMVLWLLLNKKLNQWKSTRATAAVIYALVRHMREEGTLGAREEAKVRVGSETRRFAFEPAEYAGTQQWRIDGSELDPQQHHQVVVEKETPGFMLASATWHFSTERLPSEASGDFFHVERRYLRCEKSGEEVILRPLEDGAPVRVGDEVEVQLSLRGKHAAEYVHVRDPRAAGFEPEDKLSGYHWGTVGYYQEIRDSGTSFFFDWLPAGELTLRYRIRAAMSGRFRAHPATLQPMYAPEFAAYSTGTVLSVDPS